VGAGARTQILRAGSTGPQTLLLFSEHHQADG
jgi:hypothetical protein